jgi:hypothetical protein
MRKLKEVRECMAAHIKSIDADRISGAFPQLAALQKSRQSLMQKKKALEEAHRILEEGNLPSIPSVSSSAAAVSLPKEHTSYCDVWDLLMSSDDEDDEEDADSDS